MENASSVLEFRLSGLNETSEKRYFIFAWTALWYYLTLLCNITVIFAIASDKGLHEPMYIFLCNLCINALYGTAGFYPKFLYDLLSQFHVISYAGCMIQIFVIYSSALCDFSTLTIMAYDRYVAICRPLDYHSEMTNLTVLKCILFCWLAPFCCMALVVFLTSRLALCGSSIGKLYCETWAVAKLACYSTTVNNVVGQTVIIIYFGHAVLIVGSYIRLIGTCRNSKESRYRFMQTCVPHLFTLFNFTVALLFDVFYSRYGSISIPQSLRNFFALDFLFIPPILNPLIYGLQLSRIRKKITSLYFRNSVGIS
ncbi:olfactory receptor 1D2-like [Electrophorus electricus]|uniref:olfactory receptor 1D2-like n=1 Tax=Electrophorus electricus TaxID=8005 RepID=UPI0015D090D1|nr:olfactory receptor 1D2-like [Electrophorus electricus]